MIQVDFTRTENIGDLFETEIWIEAKIYPSFDGAGQKLYEVFLELYTWEGHKKIDLFNEIYNKNQKLYKSLENEALERAV